MRGPTPFAATTPFAAKSIAVFALAPFFFCGCAGGLNKKEGYKVGAVYETVVPIVITPCMDLSFVLACHDSHLPQNLIDLRKRYSSGDEVARPGLRFRVDGVSLVVLDSAWGVHDSIDAKLLNGEYSGFGFSLKNISRSEDPLFGVMRWYPDYSIVRRIE